MDTTIEKLTAACAAASEAAHPALKAFFEEVVQCEQSPPNPDYLRVLYKQIACPKESQFAVSLLMTSANLECKRLAIEIDPSQTNECVYQLVKLAQEKLDILKGRKTAQQARHLFFIALYWADTYGPVTSELAREIEQGIRATDWTQE